MGYLNNSGEIVIDAILTKLGREKLAKGRQEFNITQFALSDDEIDYSLYNPTHPSGSLYYGAVIENMPILEAVTDETQLMRSKLICLPRNAYRVPIVNVPNTTITFNGPGQEQVITPNTKPFGNTTLGYTAILQNSEVADLRVHIPIPGVSYFDRNSVGVNYLSDSDPQKSIVSKGFAFKLVSKQNPLNDITTTLTIVGNETGGTTVITITSKKSERPASIADIINIQNM